MRAVRRDDYKAAHRRLREDLSSGRGHRPPGFELPGGKPRSASDVRVGAAFATFLAWSFGDSGTVRIEIPRPFEVSASGAEMARAVTDDATVLTATAADALSWYAWVNARNDAALTRERLDIDGGEEIVVRGWPEDERWRTRVGGVLARGVPELVELIGLPWPSGQVRSR